MNAEQSPLLDQLRDIHAVAEPSWWPPAPGWWVLAFLLFLLVAWLVQKALDGWSVRRRKQQWLKAVDQIGDDEQAAGNAHAWLAEMNRLFRAVALEAFPDARCARLEGEAWVAFIRSMLPDGTADESLDALVAGPYQPTPEFNARSIRQVAVTWVNRYG